MYNVGIIGPEASGKTTLANYLHSRYGGLLIPEYGRVYLEKKNTVSYDLSDVEEIVRHQIVELQKIQTMSTEVVIHDTELIISKIWFEEKYHFCPIWLYKALLRYPMNVYLLCYPDLPWQWERVRENGSDEQRKRLFSIYEWEIQRLAIPYYIIRHKDE